MKIIDIDRLLELTSDLKAAISDFQIKNIEIEKLFENSNDR